MLCISSYDSFIPTCIFCSSQNPSRTPYFLFGSPPSHFWTSASSGDVFTEHVLNSQAEQGPCSGDQADTVAWCLQTTAPLWTSGGNLWQEGGWQMVASVPCVSRAWQALFPCGPRCAHSCMCTLSLMVTAALSAHGPPLHPGDSTLPSSLVLVLHDMSQEVPIHSDCAHQSLATYIYCLLSNHGTCQGYKMHNHLKKF